MSIMFEGVDFSQFGSFAIVFILMAIAIVFLGREWKAEKNRAETIQNQRLLDAKETRDTVADSLKEISTSSKQIYDILVNSNRPK